MTEKTTQKTQMTEIEHLLARIPLPEPHPQRDRYQTTLSQDLKAKITEFRLRHQDHFEITGHLNWTIEFALEVLLALEPALFFDEPVSQADIRAKIKEYGK